MAVDDCPPGARAGSSTGRTHRNLNNLNNSCKLPQKSLNFSFVSEMPLTNFSGRLALAIRELIERRGMTQKALAKRIGMSESSLSLIFNGRARPRQITVTRLMQHLCTNVQEEQMLIAAYDQAEAAELPIRPAAPERPIGEDDRVRRYMEVKSMSVAFQQDVEKILRQGGFAFQHPYRQDPFICDFYLPGPPRIALDCKFNVNRDWDRSVASVKLMYEHLPVDEVLVVVPYENEISLAAVADISDQGGVIIKVSDLKSEIAARLERGARG